MEGVRCLAMNLALTAVVGVGDGINSLEVVQCPLAMNLALTAVD